MKPCRKMMAELLPAQSLNEVLRAHPTLTAMGWGRAVADSRVNAEQFEYACAFLEAHGRPLDRFNPVSGSYWVKHLAEHWAGDYISNGALIAAALGLGYQARRSMEGGPNCIFNLAVDRIGRPIGPELRRGNFSRRVVRQIAHKLAVELNLPYGRFWTAFKASVHDFPEDADELALRLDLALEEKLGTTLAAVERVFQTEVAK
jgi:hypothetical protein